MSTNTLILLSSCIQSGDGFSYNLKSGKFAPHSGYMVSIAGNELTVHLGMSDVPKVIEHYASKYREDLSKPNVYFGAWIDGCNLVLDCSVKISNIRAAKTFGKVNGQKAIYDLKHQVTIDL